MSRLPRISPRDLHQLADEERVDRMWSRLQDELPRATPAASRPRAVTWLVAASLSTFAVGLGVGHLSASSEPGPMAVSSSPDRPSIDVLAAGSERRTFALPGGARLSLEPESLVEIVEVGDGGITLRLLRGIGSFDASIASSSVAIVAGEAHVSAPAGSVVSVRRNERDVDVTVAGGSVEVVSPAGRQVVSTRDGVRSVPIVAAVSALEPSPVAQQLVVPRPEDEAVAALEPSSSPRAEVAPAEEGEAIASAPPSWLSRYQKYEFDEAYRLIEQSGGLGSTIDGAQRAHDLMALADIARAKSHSAQAIRALRRVVDEFPSDPNATVAAMTLGRMHEAMGQRELAAKYFAQAGKSAVFGEDVACRDLRAHAGESPPGAEAVSSARAFLAKFPDGSCRELAEAIVADAEEAGDEPAKPEGSKPEGKAGEPKPGEPTKPDAAPAGESKPDAPAAPAPSEAAPPPPSAP